MVHGSELSEPKKLRSWSYIYDVHAAGFGFMLLQTDPILPAQFGSWEQALKLVAGIIIATFGRLCSIWIEKRVGPWFDAKRNNRAQRRRSRPKKSTTS